MVWLTAKRIHGGWESAESFFEAEQLQSLREQWQALSKTLYAAGSDAATWDGSPLWRAFSHSQGRWIGEEGKAKKSPLPALNP